MFCLLMGITACGEKRQTQNKIVSVTIEPQRYFAEQIAGDKLTIHCVVPSGQSPESYDPTPQQIIQIGESTAYLRIGSIGFEQAWMDKIIENNPHLQVFDLSEGMSMIHLDEMEHESDHHHHHHPNGTDPHIWTSIKGAKTIAMNTWKAFTELDPENSGYYKENYNKLMQTIEATEDSIRTLLEPLNNRCFIIYHPALTYLADEFGLKQLSIEMDGKEPSPAQLKLLVETARKQQALVVFIQQEFDQKNAELIAKETGCRLSVIHPLNYEWNTEMIHIAKALAHGKAH